MRGGGVGGVGMWKWVHLMEGVCGCDVLEAKVREGFEETGGLCKAVRTLWCEQAHR